ncbi:NlpC/P60 family protein [Thermoactinospora rubra]|uniref:C40 family peptidase n=1 Tax=Thermoactinospora rubra TaxID=1088767 RepID=UPI000A10DE84|nr:C40 family peptidase [Thermoactinospora rubra]
MKRACDRAARRRLTALPAALVALVFVFLPAAASADPKPSLKELAAQAEQLHTEIEQLTEQFNGQREKLRAAEKTAAAAQKTLSTRRAELEERRLQAMRMAQNAYINGGLERALALAQSDDPDTFLDRAATASAIEEERSLQLKEVAQAMAAAEQAERAADQHIRQVKQLVSDLQARREKIIGLVAKVESRLYRQALNQTSSGGRAVRVNLPIIGKGKAAEAARWALTQQLKPYVWGAEGPNSYDCSGLVMAAYQKVGINLPHYTGDLWTAGRHISREELRPGDLVFFYNDLHHVGIYVGGGLMVHAPRTGDVVRVAPIANRPYAGAVRIAD